MGLMIMLRLAPPGLAPCRPGRHRRRADPVFPPGLPIGLEPAGDLTVLDRVPGFEDPDRKVTVSDPRPAGRPLREVLEHRLRQESPPGLRQRRRAKASRYRNGIGYLLTADATEERRRVRRLFLIAVPSAVPADAQFVALVKVDVPEAARDVYTDDVVRKMLASVTFREAPIEEQLDLIALSSSSELAGFRVVQARPVAQPS